MDREIPIILDDLADPEFGTGVVKVTPAHDPNDFEAGTPPQPAQDPGDRRGRHDDRGRRPLRRARPLRGAQARGRRSRSAGPARQDRGPYTLSLGKCQRCKTVVEPLDLHAVVRQDQAAGREGHRGGGDGRIQFVPANWSKTYFEWMYNIRDWCISRQLWWGHRIPAWHCQECREITSRAKTPTTCPHCGASHLEQDTDVLDTWFSSGLWPFSTLGWPDQTEDLATFYPTSLLITGFDILFFWVARMVMLGIEFMGEVPFRQVYIHGLVRDAERQKMSKTKGNVIDPLVVTEQYGTDAVRMALLRAPRPAPTSCSPKSAWKARAPSPTRSGTPPASSS